MNKYFFLLLLNLFFTSNPDLFAEDSTTIKVHFLYGSKPKKEFQTTEKKWFGGKMGGHVGIEFKTDSVIDFVPSGKFHVFGKKNERHSRFAIRRTKEFWEIFGGKSNEVKKASFIIPVSFEQKKKLDSIVQSYSRQTPYDYAFFLE